MKTKLILALFIGSLTFSLNAQVNVTPKTNQTEAQKQKHTPEKVAERQANKAITTLGLTTEQKSQFQAFSLTRINAVRPLRQKMTGSTDKVERKTLHKEINSHLEEFYNNVNEILTLEQKAKWEEQKSLVKEQNKVNKTGKVPFED